MAFLFLQSVRLAVCDIVSCILYGVGSALHGVGGALYHIVRCIGDVVGGILDIVGHLICGAGGVIGHVTGGAVVRLLGGSSILCSRIFVIVGSIVVVLGADRTVGVCAVVTYVAGRSVVGCVVGRWQSCCWCSQPPPWTEPA